MSACVGGGVCAWRHLVPKSFKHHAIMLRDCLLWHLPTLISMFGVEHLYICRIYRHFAPPEPPKLQVQKLLDLFFIEDTLGSLGMHRPAIYVCIWDMYNNVFLWSILLIQNDFTCMPCICKPIIIECLVFYPKAAKNGSNLHMHMFFKNGWQIPRVLGPHRCGCLGDVMDVMWCDRKWWVRLCTLGCLPQ